MADALADALGTDCVIVCPAFPGAGHFDLTDSLGILGQFEHPDFLAAVERIAAACEQYGKVAGFLDLNPDLICLLRDKGFQLLGYGHDVGVFQAGLRQGLEQIRNA